MIQAVAGSPFTTIVEGAPSGLAGTIGVKILNADGTTQTARTTAGIVELVPGTYRKLDLVAPATEGSYFVVWDTGGGAPQYATEDLEVKTVTELPGDQFTKEWLDNESGGTPVDAEGLNDFEARSSLRAKTYGLVTQTLTGVTNDIGQAISGRVVVPGSSRQNGIIVRRPNSSYGSPAHYGDAQAFLLIKEGTGSVHDDLVLARIDGRSGAGGFGGGIHSAGGLHKEVADPALTQNAWIQNSVDTVGVVVNAFGTTPAFAYQLWNDGVGATKAAVTKDGVLGAYAANATYGSLFVSSPSSSQTASISFGRGGVAVESAMGVIAAASSIGGVAGDTQLQTVSGNLVFGVQGALALSASPTALFAGLPLLMNTHKISGVLDPTAAQDAATKNYVDTKTPSGATYFPVFGFGAATVTAPVANTLYYGRVLVHNPAPLTGIYVWNGGAVSGNVRVALYDSAGNRVADRTTNVAQAGANNVQKIPFDAPYFPAPGVYYAAIMFDNTTARFFTVTGGLVPTGSAAQGSFATPSSITVPTSPAASPAVIGTY